MSSARSDRPKFGGRYRFLLGLERFSRGHYKVVFLIALVVAIGGTMLGTQLRIESDILALIPEGNRQVDGFKKAVAEFGSVSYLVMLLEAGEHDGPDELEDFADLFAERLGQYEDLVEFIEFRLDPGAEFLDLFYDNALLYLPPEKLSELEQKLSNEAILRQVEQNRLRLSSPTASFVQELMVNDPLELMPLLFRPAGSLGHLKVDLTDGYYLSRDGRDLIMLVKPTGTWQDLASSTSIFAAMSLALRGSWTTESRCSAMLVKLHVGAWLRHVLPQTDRFTFASGIWNGTKKTFAKNFKYIEQESNKQYARRLTQKVDNKTLIINPPFQTMTELEIDSSFDLPFTRVPHPKYAKRGNIPAYEMIKHSIN